tara:strand:- start:847 stop:1710 length:864 start_codon:yes stop_codon:yes gene_type:complete
MAGEIKSQTTTLDDLLAPIVQEALFVASERSIMRGLVRNFTVPANAGKVLQVPIYPTVTAAALTEADDLGMTAVSTSKADITLSEVGFATNVSDLSVNFSSSNVIADLGKLMGDAIARKMDRDLTALFSGFSTYAFTTATAEADIEMTAEHLFRAAAKLKASAVPGPYFGVFNPKSIFNMKKTMTSTFVPQGNTGVVNQAMTEGYVGRIAGIDIFETSNVVESSATSCVNAVFSRDALGLAIGTDMKIETQRDASARATELVATATYGVSELHDSYGVKVVTDNQVD